MKTFLNKIRSIPRFGWLFGFGYFALQYGMYRLGDLLSRLLGTINYAFAPKIPFIDDRIPVIAIFAIIYLYSYVFWICGPVAASLTSRRNFVNYITGLSAAYIIGFLFFVFMRGYKSAVRHDGKIRTDDIFLPALFSVLLMVVMIFFFSTAKFNI